MNNYRKHLDDLNFHDSNIESIIFENGDSSDRKLTITIDYYNWENNTEDSNTWTTRTLKLIINHCVHLQINTPNLVEDTFEIMSEEYDLLYDTFVNKAMEEKSKSFYHYLKSKQLDNFLSLKFNVNNYSDSLFNETAGFIWIAGFNVQHEWLDKSIGAKKHIAVK